MKLALRRDWKNVAAFCAVGLASFGCAKEPNAPVGYTPERLTAPVAYSRQPPTTRGVTAVQPEAEVRAADQAVEPPQASPDNAAQTRDNEPRRGAPDPEDVTTPAAGETPVAPPTIRTRVARSLAAASQQIDRLRRMEESSSGAAPREVVDSAMADLENKRERVLQDLREFELRADGRTTQVSTMLEHDVATLEDAVQSSHALAPPPSQGLPQPSPLPPSHAW
jgi:hypothetical protein